MRGRKPRHFFSETEKIGLVTGHIKIQQYQILITFFKNRGLVAFEIGLVTLPIHYSFYKLVAKCFSSLYIYDHMRVERYVPDEQGVPEQDKTFIRQ